MWLGAKRSFYYVNRVQNDACRRWRTVPPHGAEAKSQIGAYDAELDFRGCNYHSCGPIWAGSARHGAIDDERRARHRATDIMFAPCRSARA